MTTASKELNFHGTKYTQCTAPLTRNIVWIRQTFQLIIDYDIKHACNMLAVIDFEIN